MADSILKQVVARLQEAMAEPDMGLGCDVYRVRGYDVRVLFETIKRYGGRSDWTPTEANVEQLAGPVRRHIRRIEAENRRLTIELQRSNSDRVRREQLIHELRHPRR